MPEVGEDDDGSAALAALTRSAGKLPPRLNRCAYDAENRNWVPANHLYRMPKAQRSQMLQGYTHQVEQARSGVSTCKRCGEKIPKLSLRIGYPAKDQRGEYGAVPCWLHLACARRGDTAAVALAKSGDTALRTKLLGFDALSGEDKYKLCDGLLVTADEREEEEDRRKMAPPAEIAPRQLPRCSAPAQLTVEMLPFQAEGLHWMLEREADSDTLGGVLADEMGMGKTLQSISLILASPNPGPTLVVCPAAAMLQWRNEILRFVQPGSLEVECYYGGNRKSLNFDGKVNTVVLTTYQTLETDYRQEVNKHKVPCQWCQRLFLPDKLKYHQKYFCGPDAERTEKQNKQERKTEAVKMMKIGGSETSIQLNPLGAIRGAATRAARRLTRKTPASEASRDLACAMDGQPDIGIGSTEGQPAASSSSSSSTSPAFMPFPVAVLPEEARATLGYGNADEAVSPNMRGRGKGRGRGRGQKRKIVADVAEASASCTKLTPSPSRLKFGRKLKLAAPTPSPPAKPNASTTAPAGSSSLGAAWSAALQKPAAPKVIDLDLSDSDLEMTVEPSSGLDAQGSGDVQAAPAPDCVENAFLGRIEDTVSDSLLPPRPSGQHEDDRGVLDLSRSALFRTRWSRTILDEAHRIKTRTNSTAQAAFAIHSRTRWCLSGTPLQNRVGELYSIVRFIRFYPYAHYICSKKGCKCASLHYRFSDNRYCDCCGHTKMQHRSHFAGVVSNPIKKFGFIGAGKTAMEKLRSEVLDRILLRRTKAERQADMNLPPLQIRIRRDALSAEERDFYTSMYTQSRTQFDTYVNRGTVLHNYAHVFDLIMRLRQAVDHPYLIIHGSLESTEKGAIPTESRGDADVCALCQDDVDDPRERAVAQCGHIFHRECVAEYLEQAPELPTGGIGCPACFAPLTVNLEELEEEADEVQQPSRGKACIMQRIKSAKFKSSTKIEALMEEIKKMMAASSASKALVFSQFVNFLELIEWRLKREGVSSAKLTGSMPIQSRSNIIISFQTDPSLKVLLISLKAGGEGLNLQAADHIFVMDPWWNPASELQAIQRAHRIGQTRPVFATRLVASDTIEDKIIELQEKKQSVFDCTVGNNNQALSRLTAEDIQFLFNQ